MTSLNDAFENYLADLKRRGKKTIPSIERFYANNIEGEIGHKRLDKIKRTDIKKLFNQWSIQTPSLANRCLGIISCTYNTAIEDELIQHNPCLGIKKNREIERKRYYTQTELQNIFKVLDEKDKNPRNQLSVACIKLLIYTGARRGEIALTAKWGDLKGNRLVLSNHKTDDKTGDRVIFLNEYAMTIINGLKRKGDGVAIIGQTPDRLWRSVRLKSNCKDLRLHDLRHSFATTAFKSNKVSLAEIGNLLGHKSINSTMRYTHILDETAQRNVSDVGQEIFKYFE